MNPEVPRRRFESFLPENAARFNSELVAGASFCDSLPHNDVVDWHPDPDFPAAAALNVFSGD
jgi:hypothetical protein